MRYFFLFIVSILFIGLISYDFYYFSMFLSDPSSEFILTSRAPMEMIGLFLFEIIIYPAVCVAIISLGKIKDRIKSKQTQ